jgi:excinuclease ABC subunit A
MELHEVGVNVKSPWQVDGQRWHTKDRVGRNGEQVHWDGKILREVVQRIEQHDGFSETNWNERTVVEICGRSKSAGWFFHAITGDAWLLTMKFRVRPKTFRSQELLNRISLPTANEMDELPIYGNQSRVAVTNTRNHWQEIEIRPHSWKEIDTPEFWQFVDEAVESFLNRAKRAALKLEDQTPWAKLGEKWHLLRKGFAQGEIVWNVNVLQSMKAVIENVASKAEFVWDNKTVVHVYLPELPSPWISIHSKKPDGLWINLSANKGQVNLGRVVGIADDVSVVPNSDRELVRMKFVNERQVLDPNWRLFLLEHLNNSNSSIKA